MLALLHFRRTVLLLCWLSAPIAFAAGNMQIPRISTPPRLRDFENMTPHGNATQLAKVEGFIQQAPSDGQPGTERTEVYLGYDSANLYIIWVCWDSKPHAMRGHLTRREAVTPPDDDYVELTLDTFRDRRHGFLFDVNPRGIQADALWSEDSGADYSFDTVWDSRAPSEPARLRNLDGNSLPQYSLPPDQRPGLGCHLDALHRAQR